MAYPFRPLDENNLRTFLEVSKKYFSSHVTDCTDKDTIPPSNNSHLEIDCFSPEGNSALINQEVTTTPVK